MRLGILCTPDFDDPKRLAEELGRRRSDNPDLVIVASREAGGIYALDWAAEAGIGYEEVPAGKVRQLSDEVLTFEQTEPAAPEPARAAGAAPSPSPPAASPT